MLIEIRKGSWVFQFPFFIARKSALGAGLGASLVPRVRVGHRFDVEIYWPPIASSVVARPQCGGAEFSSSRGIVLDFCLRMLRCVRRRRSGLEFEVRQQEQFRGFFPVMAFSPECTGRTASICAVPCDVWAIRIRENMRFLRVPGPRIRLLVR